MNKKFLWIIIVLIILAAGIIAFLMWPKPELEPEPKLPSIKIGGARLLTDLAVEKGFFEEEGLQIKIVDPGTMPWEENSLMLMAGEFDYALVLGQHASSLIEASLKGAPIKTIMLLDKMPALFLVTQPEIENISNLKTIGIAYSYVPLNYYHALRFIEDYNIETEIIIADPEKQTHPITQTHDWLLRGEVDAILIGANAYLLENQGFKIMDIPDYVLPSVLSVREDKIEENPEEVQKMIQIFEKTMESVVAEPETTKDLMLNAFNMERTEENIRFIEKYYPFFQKVFNRRNVPYDEGAELLIKIAKAGEFKTTQEIEKQTVTQEELNRVFDFRFVK